MAASDLFGDHRDDPASRRPRTTPTAPVRAVHGRGAASSPGNRFAGWQREGFDDGWTVDESLPARTELIVDATRSIITRNDSPDIPFSQSINPYRGCEHGCAYCYARPSHAELGYSPGIDFETRIVYKPDAAPLLRRELARPGYRCMPIAIGVNTDAWQPAGGIL